MKKLSFLFAMVLAANVVMAQNTSNITQTGNTNDADVTQTGSNLLNGSQTGNLNEATVTQISTTASNEALFEQGGGIYEPNPGNSNDIVISQNGASNYAKSREYHSGNKASITQIGNLDIAKQWIWGGNGNTAIQSQTGGNQNYSEIAINGLNGVNDARTNQVGNKNIGSIGQGWSGRAHGSNTASISQIGDQNKVDLSDYYAVGELGGYTIDLVGLGVQQYGSGNVGRVTQDGYRNSAAIWQFGDANTGVLIQNTSNYGKAVLVQIGSHNAASLTQSYGSDADIYQEGNSNTLKGAEGWNIMATSLNGSTLELDQLGNGNTLGLQQTNGASATVMQDGMTNTSVIIQN
jgi:hypothetical protein